MFSFLFHFYKSRTFRLNKKMFFDQISDPLGKGCHGDLGDDFRDGTRLILLVGQLGGFFVPLYEYVPDPKSRKDMIANVKLGLDLLKELKVGDRFLRIGEKYADIGLRPDTLVKGDQDTVIRILHDLSWEFA